jgi:hypothetical protein
MVSSLGDTSDRIEWSRTSVRLFVLLIVFAFLAPRLLLLAFASGFPIADGEWYFGRALSIVSGQGYVFGGKVTAFWPIGYPGFLAFLYLILPQLPLTGLIANFFLSAITVVCSFYIFRCLRVGTFWSLFGCLVLSIYPTFVFYQQMLLSEILTATLIMAAVLGLLVSRNNLHYFATGIIFGLATLVKSQVLLLVVLAPLYDVVARRSIRACVANYVFLSFGLAVTVLPWTARNFIEFDRFILVQSNGGYNLFVGNNPTNIYGAGINADMLAAAYPSVVSDITKPLPDEMGMNDRATAAAWQFITEHPLEVLRRVPHKLFRFFRHDGLPFKWIPRSNALEGRKLPWLMPFFEISEWYHIIVVTLAILSALVFLAGPARTKAHYLLLCTIGSFALITAVFFGQARFAVPVIPAFVGCMLVSLQSLQVRFYRPLVPVLADFSRRMTTRPRLRN